MASPRGSTLQCPGILTPRAAPCTCQRTTLLPTGGSHSTRGSHSTGGSNSTGGTHSRGGSYRKGGGHILRAAPCNRQGTPLPLEDGCHSEEGAMGAKAACRGGMKTIRLCKNARVSLGNLRWGAPHTAPEAAPRAATPVEAIFRGHSDPRSTAQDTPSGFGFGSRAPLGRSGVGSAPGRRLASQCCAPGGGQGRIPVVLAQGSGGLAQADSSEGVAEKEGAGSGTAGESTGSESLTKGEVHEEERKEREGKEEEEEEEEESENGSSREREMESIAEDAASQIPLGHGGRSIDEFYAKLGLPPFKEIPGKPFTVRVRQHVNPLKSSLAGPTVAPDWGTVFQDPSLPLFLDVGCASARLSLLMALQLQPGASLDPQNLGPQLLGPHNVLGLEIRAPLVERANAWAHQLGLMNAHFLVTNATLSLSTLLQDYPGELRFVAVLCPDPQFKKKHRKRRIVQRPFVEAVARRIAPAGAVFLQSDILEVAVDMRNQFAAHAPGLLQEWHPTREPQALGLSHKGQAEPEGDSHSQGLAQEAQVGLGGEVKKGEGEAASGNGIRNGVQGECEGRSEREGVVRGRLAEDGGEEGQGTGRGVEVIEWIEDNPLGVPSEREAVVLSKGLPVYRTLLVRR